MGRETLEWLHRSTEVVAAEFVAFLEARDLGATAVAAEGAGTPAIARLAADAAAAGFGTYLNPNRLPNPNPNPSPSPSPSPSPGPIPTPP